MVVSRALKFVTPETDFSVTCCANAAAPTDNAARVVKMDNVALMKASARILLRNAAVPPPAQKFHRPAMVEDEHEEAQKQADRNHPVAADDMLAGWNRKLAAEPPGKLGPQRFVAVADPDADVFGKDRLQDRQAEEREAEEIADQDSERRPEPDDGRHREMPDGAQHRHDTSGRDRLVHDSLG